MTERKWVPAEYVDEVTPPGRASPSEWIVTCTNGHFLEPFDGGWTATEPFRKLEEGAVVLFDWIEQYGEMELRFVPPRERGGGPCWKLEGEAPTASEGAELLVMAIGEPESVQPSLAEFIECWDEPGEVLTVKFYGWSRESVGFVFRNSSFHAAALAGGVAS